MEYLRKDDLNTFFVNNLKNNIDFNYISENINDTKTLAKVFAKHLHIGDIIVLNGELGSR